jgi:hypothetical protein
MHMMFFLPISNRLSGHYAQCLILKNIYNLQKQKVQEITARIVNKESVAQFQNKLHNEKWEYIYIYIYICSDVNATFNLLLNTYLFAYESCFLNKR